MNFFIHDPITGEDYTRDPRNIARKAVAYMRSTGIADTAYSRPRSSSSSSTTSGSTSANAGFYHVDSVEGAWTPGPVETTTSATRSARAATSPSRPTDNLGDLRDEMVIEPSARPHRRRTHHEVATGGQAEINYRFDELVEAADQVMTFKYIIRNVARRNGKTATFMPKPLFGDNGSGMHCHLSLWKGRAAVPRRDRLRRPLATWPATTSAACSSTPRRCWRSPTRRPTATSA